MTKNVALCKTSKTNQRQNAASYIRSLEGKNAELVSRLNGKVGTFSDDSAQHAYFQLMGRTKKLYSTIKALRIRNALLIGRTTQNQPMPMASFGMELINTRDEHEICTIYGCPVCRAAVDVCDKYCRSCGQAICYKPPVEQ